MTNEQRMGFLMAMFTLIFASREKNTDITQERVPAQWLQFLMPGQNGYGRWFKGNLRGFDVALNLGTAQAPVPLPLRLIEQNPFKLKSAGGYTSTAVLAQQGHKIMWVIKNDKSDTFFGSIQDGVWKASETRAVQNVPTQTGYNPPVSPGPAPQPQAKTQTYTGPSIPPVSNDVDVAEYVVSQLGDYEFEPDDSDITVIGEDDDTAPWE